MNNLPASYWSYLALFLVILTLWMAYRFRSESLLDGLQKLSGYTVTWLGLLFIFLIFFPLALRLIPIYMASQWQPVVAQYSADGQNIAKDADSVFSSTLRTLKGATYSEASAGNAQPSISNQPIGDTYIVQPGDTFNEVADNLGIDRNELAQFNASNIPNLALLEVGDEILIPSPSEPIPLPVIAVTLTNPIETSPPNVIETPAPPTPTAFPTPTPTPAFLDEILEVQKLRSSGQYFSADEILNGILDQNPDHPEALKIKEKITKAKAVIVQWNSLRTSTKANHDLAHAVLAGYTFEIVANESKLFQSNWNETTTLKSVTPGWTYGTQFKLPRGHIYRLTSGYDPIGLVFEVK